MRHVTNRSRARCSGRPGTCSARARAPWGARTDRTVRAWTPGPRGTAGSCSAGARACRRVRAASRIVSVVTTTSRKARDRRRSAKLRPPTLRMPVASRVGITPGNHDQMPFSHAPHGRSRGIDTPSDRLRGERRTRAPAPTLAHRRAPEAPPACRRRRTTAVPPRHRRVTLPRARA